MPRPEAQRDENQRPIAFFVPSMRCGGSERMTLHLAQAAAQQGLRVELVVAQAEGPFLDHVGDSVRLVDLRADSLKQACLPLVKYIRQAQPTALISRTFQANVVAVSAKILSRVETRILVTEANHLSARLGRRATKPRSKWLVHGILAPTIRAAYRRADAIAAVSQGVADDLAEFLRIDSARIHALRNPAVTSRMLSQAAQPPSHPWLAENPRRIPTLIAAGSLTVKKDHRTMLAAFREVRSKYELRLIIFGDGPLRAELERTRDHLWLQNDCDFAGHCENIYAEMSAADGFIHSSRFEGSPNVLAEALACGCPVASTDCPSGPAEILDGGRLGCLAPVGHPQALAQAVTALLHADWDKNELRDRGREYSADSAIRNYLRLLNISLPTDVSHQVPSATNAMRRHPVEAA